MRYPNRLIIIVITYYLRHMRFAYRLFVKKISGNIVVDWMIFADVMLHACEKRPSKSAGWRQISVGRGM